MRPNMMRTVLAGLGMLLIGAGCSGSSAAPAEGGDDTTQGDGGSQGVGGSTRNAGGGGTKAGGTGAGGSTVYGGATGSGGKTGSGGATGSGGNVGPSQWVKTARPGGTCADVTAMVAKPDEDKIYVSTWKQAIWATTDGAATFTQVGAIDHGPVTLLLDPEHPDVFWQSGMYGGPGIYKSADNGASITAIGGSLTHLDGMSVDFSDPSRKTILTGGHEQKQKLYRSTDGGNTFSNIGTSFDAALSSCTFPLIVDTQTYLVGCSGNGWIQGTLGVYRSTDAGATWTSVNDQAAAPEPLVASDGTIYWTILYNRGMLVSTNKGVSFTQPINYGNIVPATAVELPDGRVVAAGVSGKRLQATSDKGKTWKPIATPVPWDPSGIAYSKFRKAFYIRHADCTGGTGDAIMRHPFDWTTPDGSPAAGDAAAD